MTTHHMTSRELAERGTIKVCPRSCANPVVFTMESEDYFRAFSTAIKALAQLRGCVDNEDDARALRAAVQRTTKKAVRRHDDSENPTCGPDYRTCTNPTCAVGKEGQS